MRESVFHYTILEKLGEGGMGTVYLAEDTRLKRKVALKFLPEYISENDNERERFKVEAQAAAALNHANITQVYAIEESEDELCIVMEYVKGDELKERVEEGSLTAEHKLRIARQIAEGIKVAHQKDIIHRDIKSGNIMIDEEGNVKIMDFGLARIKGSAHITKTGSTLGTTAYMSPEQLRGNDVDERSDLWSFGVVLYEMFTGELPFQGVYEPAVMYSISENDPKPPRSVNKDIPQGMENVIERCLEKDRERRYQNITELIQDLNSLQKSLEPGYPGAGERRQGAGIDNSRRILTVWTPLALLAVLLFFLVFRSGIQSEYYINSDLPETRKIALFPFSADKGNPEVQILRAGLYETITGKLKELEQLVPTFTIVDPEDILNERNEIRTVKDANRVFNANLGTTGEINFIDRWLFKDQIEIKMRLHHADTNSALDSVIIRVPKTTALSTISGKVETGYMRLLQLSGNKEANEAILKKGSGVPSARDLYIRGNAYLGMEQRDTVNMNNAINLFKQALKLDPDYAAAYAALGKGYWNMYELTSNSVYVDSAQNALIDALNLNNRLTSVKETMGTIQLGTGQYEKARDQFQEVTNLEPGNADAWRGLAQAYERLGNLDKAEETYLAAIEKVSANWRGYLDLGRFYYQQGKPDRAKFYYEQAEQLSPNNYRLLNNLGTIYLQRGDLTQAEEYLQKSFDIRENFAALNNLANIYRFKNNYKEAARMYEKAIDLRPADHRVWAHLATMSELLPGKEKEAFQQYEKAIELAEEELEVNPNNSITRAYLANYYSEIGKGEEALKNLDKAVGGNSNISDMNIQILALYTYEQLGEREKALNWAEKLLKNGYPANYLKGDSEMKDLVKDSRFKEIEKNLAAN